MNISEFFYYVFVPWWIAFCFAGFVLFWRLRWNIPVAVLRFTGDKRRPMLFLTRGRKAVVKGVPHLWVKKYKEPVRDFRSENYYPAPRSKWGGLVLFEFEDGWLTPLRPAWKRLTDEQKQACARASKVLMECNVVDFEYDKFVHDKLKLTIVDDVDADFFVDNLARQKAQYSTHWDRLQVFLVPVAFVVLGVLALIGWIMWLRQDPANCAMECVQALPRMCQGVVESSGLGERLVEAATPGG